MHYPRLSLQAVAAAANLAHELTTVRKSRINALGVVDLCSTGACKDYNVDCEGSAVVRHGRCLQVIYMFPLATLIAITSIDCFGVTGNAQCKDFGQETGVK